MSRRVYTDEDKAKGLALLAVHEGNIKRTARELDIPINTVRAWKQAAEKDNLPVAVGEALPAVAEDFVADFGRVRDKALLELERQIENGDVKGQALVTAVGVLTDKIRVAEGLATSRNEHVNLGPSAQEQAMEVLAYLARTATRVDDREADIVDAELVEQAPAALDPPQS